jgi:hypothetical protein
MRHKPFFMAYPPRPEHDAALDLHRFETQEQSEGELTRLVRTLKAAGEEEAANALIGCRIDQPCWRAHCPVCTRQFRRWFIAAAMQLIEDLPKNNLYAVSIIPANMTRKPGELSTLPLLTDKESLRRRFSRCLPPNAQVLLGIDASMNHDETKRDGSFLPHWQFHLYGLIWGVSKADLKRILHRLFPSSPAVPRPVQIKEITDLRDLMAIVSYAMKSGFTRRVSYISPTNGRVASRKVGLKARETAELMSYLAQYRPCDRLLLLRVRRRGTQLVSTICR